MQLTSEISGWLSHRRCDSSRNLCRLGRHYGRQFYLEFRWVHVGNATTLPGHGLIDQLDLPPDEPHGEVPQLKGPLAQTQLSRG